MKALREAVVFMLYSSENGPKAGGQCPTSTTAEVWVAAMCGSTIKARLD